MTQHILLRSPTFVRAAKRLLKRHPTSAPDIAAALSELAADPHHPSLKSHKLTGPLKSS